MCDCFHLAFPNWHASAAGDGRRLKGPEQDFSDEFTCEEPEVLEGERPRPQGSSPVDDFPTTEKHRKQADDDLYESPTKSSKKRRIGLGSLFDKRSYPRTNLAEDGLTDPSEIITAKEVCAEGLVVGGGGKDGIFVKEVKPESPASKTLIAKEGDQILSATIYFENVSYEDALQILEHAQPYKMAFCLKRKLVSSATPGALETEHPTTATDAERKEEGAEMRAQRKMKKQHDRISWPKFPSFSKGHRANFKRSHSTSEAEEHRKLEISPPTSDTESPIKSQLKSPDRKDKKKSHRMKLKMRMSGNRSKSVEEAQENEQDLTTDNVEVLKNQTIVDIEEEQPPPAITTEAENIEDTKEKYEFTTSSASQDVEILSKPSNAEAVIQEDEDVEQIERSDLNICMKGNDKYEAVTESQQSLSSGNVASNLSIFKNLETFSVVSQTDPKENQEDVYHTQAIEEIQGPGENGENKIKDVASLDIPNGGRSKSPSISSYKEKKERGILETESYGIRTRGPLGDIATASHFEKNINSIEFTPSDSFTFENNTKRLPYYSSTPTAIEKSNVITRDIKCSKLVVDNSELTKQANVPQVLGKNSESKFKLPKVEVDFSCHARRQTDSTKAGFPKREEIEIPGMEDKKSKGKFPSATCKESKIEKIINISKLDMGQAQKQTEEFNVECVKEAVSKFPAFKLPERDITGVLVQREITIMEKKLDKPGVSPRDSPCKMSFISTDVSAMLPEETMDVEQTVCPLAPSPKTKVMSPIDEKFASKSKTNKSKTLTELQQSDSDKLLARDDKMITPLEENFTFPKREDIEIPGMEATEPSVHQQHVYGDQDEATLDKVVKEFPVAAATEKSQSDKKVQEKKSKKSKVTLPSFGIMTPDIRFPGLSIDLQMKSYKSKSPCDDLKEMQSGERSQDEEHGSIEKVCKPHATDKKCAKQNESLFGKASVWHQEENINDAEQIEQTISRDTNIIVSPQKKKLLNLKMPKIGKSIKGMTEATSMVMETAPENSTFEVIPDSENKSCETGTKIVFEADKIVSKIKIPSIDVSVPKLKMPKTEGKLLEEETRISKPHSNALSQHDLNQKTGPTKQCIDAQEDVGLNVTKFGISLEKENTQSNVLPEKAEQLSGTADVKTTGLQQTEIKEKDPKTKKMKILFPNFVFSKPDVSEDRESLPLKQDPTQEKMADEMEADLKNNTNYTESEFKNSEDSASKFKLPTIKLSNFEVSFPKTAEVKTGVQMLETSTKEMNVDVNITENKWIEAPQISEQKIVDFSFCDVSPVLNINTPKRNVFSETEDKINLLDPKVQATDLSKPSSVHKSNLEIKESNLISKFGDVHKDLNITASVELDSEALPTTVFDDFLTKKHEGVDVSVEPNPKNDLKELPRIDSCLSHADDNKPEDRVLALGTVQLDSRNIESIQKAEVSKKSPTKFKLPSITFPKLTFSKATDSELDDQLPEVTTSAELPEAELSVPEIKVSHQIPKERSGTEDSKDTKYLEDKGLDKDATLPSEALDVIIQEGKEKDSEQKMKKRKISFPKFGFSKSESKILENTVPAVEIPEPECEVMESEVARPVHEVQSKNKSNRKKKIGSPSKFKLPTISLPKFDISVSKPEKDLVKFEQKTSYEKTKVDSTEVSTQDVGLSKTVFETVAVDAEIKNQEEAQETQEKFMLPKFEFSLPKLKIPELKQFSLGTEKAQNSSEAVTYDSEIVTRCASDLIDTSFPAKEVKEQLPSDLDIKSDVKSLTVREMEVKAFEPDSIPKTEILKDAKTSGGSPIKFKLPAFKIPKFGSLSSKSKPEIKDACPDKTCEPTDVLSVDHADTDKLTGLTVKTDLSKEKPSVPETDIENKVDSQDDSFKVPGMKLKRPAFSFPKFGFSKAEIKDSVVDVNSSQFDSSEPKDELEDLDKSEVKLKDLTTDGTTDKVKLPVINSSSGRKSTKDDKIIPEESKRPDVRGLDQQIKKPDETLHVDVKDPSFVEEHLNDLQNVVNGEDIADKGHKCVIALQEIDTKKQDVFIEVNVPMPEQEFEELVENLKTNSMPDIKVKEVPSTDLPKPKIEDKRVDNSSKAEDEQINATIFSSPTKFKVPSISLPKFGFKSQKMELDNVVTDSDLNQTASENEVKEKNPAVSDVHYKEQQDKDKKTGFSFPKIAFSKSDLDEKFSESKEGMYNETGTGAEKGADSTTTFQMSGNRLSTIELKKPELSLPLVDIETTKSVVNESDDTVSALIAVIDKKVKTTETIIDALSDKSAALLPEENISSLPDLNMPFAGKAESSSADLKSQDKKITKSLLAFSKPDEKSQDVVTCQPKTSITLQVSNLLDKEDSESTHEQNKKEGPNIVSQSRFKLPSFSLPKFGIRKENAEIPNTNIDIDKTAALKQTNEMKKHVDTEGLSVGVVNKSKDNNQPENKETMKLPKLSQVGQNAEQTLLETDDVTTDVLSVDKKELILNKESVEIEGGESNLTLPKIGISQQGHDIGVVSTTTVGPSQAIDPILSTTEAQIIYKPTVLNEKPDGRHVKTDKSVFAFPKFGFSKSEIKVQDMPSNKSAADISGPVGSTEKEEKDVMSAKVKTTSPFGSPTKFKLPTIKLPKFGVSAKFDSSRTDHDTKEIANEAVEDNVGSSSQDVTTKPGRSEILSIETCIKETGDDHKENAFKIPKFGIVSHKEIGYDVKMDDVRTPEAEAKLQEDGFVVQKLNTASKGLISSIKNTEEDTELKADAVASKFKLPAIKIPSFAISVPKTSKSKVKPSGVEISDTKKEKTEDITIQAEKSKCVEIETTKDPEQPSEASVKNVDGNKGSPSKFKLPTMKRPKLSISKTKSHDEDDSTLKANVSELNQEAVDLYNNSKVSMPSMGEVIKGFEVELNVPTQEDSEALQDNLSENIDNEVQGKVEELPECREQEKSKFKFKFPKLGFSQTSDDSEKLNDAKIEENEKLDGPSGQEVETKPDKGGWFKFSRFSSPTKSDKSNEKEYTQPKETIITTDLENDSSKAIEILEKSSPSEIVDENISPTLSLRSSEAFADVSSTLTTEQVCDSQESTSKVKVKYSEPVAAAFGVNEVQTKVVTSTARCELISMEPDLPEKVNIPYSSDLSSASVDTFKQMSGEIHVITSNIQAIPDSQKSAIFTSLDAQGRLSSPLPLTIASDPVLTVEETRVLSGKLALMERHVVKEATNDNKETVLVTRTTRAFEEDSVEPISDETALSIQRLKDSVHTEKMRFFESVEVTKEAKVVNTETLLRHMDSSAEENNGT